MTEFEKIYKVFHNLLQIDTCVSLDLYKSEFNRLREHIKMLPLSVNELENNLLSIIVKKLDLYNSHIKSIIDSCAKESVYFNYHEKLFISKCVESNHKSDLYDFLRSKHIVDLNNILSYNEYEKEEILSLFHNVVDCDPKKNAIIESILSAFLYSVFHETDIHNFNTKTRNDTSTFYQYLKTNFPSKYDRTNTLSLLHVDEALYRSFGGYQKCLASLYGFIKCQYSALINYSFFSILIDNINDGGESVMWSLYSDIVLYAEKFIEEELKIGYFHPDVIEQTTSKYISEMNKDKARFNIANSGFIYRDCFIIPSKNISSIEKEHYVDYKILILFQKNERDEDVIPCPCCRSFNVRGNSYPTIGVKSWECNNLLCPDKSKYNRGKRYSLASIIKQEAIEDSSNEIDKENLAEWRLDVVSPKSLMEIVEYLIKQYSFSNDTVYLYNIPNIHGSIYSRIIKNEKFEPKQEVNTMSFYNSAYFQRFRINEKNIRHEEFVNISPYNDIEVYNGDCKSVLRNIPSNFFNGAVTSPPYYNAKEYSQWSNIYCYLYDMYNHANEVFRTLKPGAYFLYNIFDYFDNENNIVFSAMGKKRMILGAYIIHLFKHIGFELQQNIIWYKGNVQGHRSTNQGNNSPYYQAPINCYEHIFCFKKPGNEMPNFSFPTILKASPVIKMIKGKNTLGHTAPYPEDIPNLLTDRICNGIILDPYSGSFTTARAAHKRRLRSVNIELSIDYCNLGLNIIKKQYNTQGDLFLD